MNIILLSRKYSRGEAWCNRLLAFARGFQCLGCSTKLIFLVSNEQSIANSSDFKGLDVKFVSNFSDNDSKIKKLFIYVKALASAKKLFKTEDVVITSDGGGTFLTYLRFFTKVRHIYTEITEHPGNFYPQNYNCVIKRYAALLRVRLHEKLLIQNISKINGLFVISKSLKKFFIANGVDERKISLINMFVDASRFNIKKNLANKPYIAYCGTVTFDKDGVDILIKSFAKFHESHPEYRLKIIGPIYEKKVQEEIPLLLKKCRIEHYVELTGKVAPSEMPSLLMDASILALSRPDNMQNRNGFPTKLGEYLATGNPIVVTAIGEIPQFIHDKKNGYLANPNDVQSFYEKLCEVADNYDIAIQVGMQGKKLVINEFSSIEQARVALKFINRSYEY